MVRAYWDTGPKTLNNLWRMDVRDLQESIGWHPVFKFDEELYAQYERLADRLNQMDVPFQVRIARDTG